MNKEEVFKFVIEERKFQSKRMKDDLEKGKIEKHFIPIAEAMIRHNEELIEILEKTLDNLKMS